MENTHNISWKTSNALLGICTYMLMCYVCHCPFIWGKCTPIVYQKELFVLTVTGPIKERVPHV